jgi:hypothetical protein
MDFLTTNQFKVVGRLVSQNLQHNQSKTGKGGFISGNATVVANLDGKNNEFEISFFANQTTADGKESQLYVSYSKMGELVGKKVEITGSMRESRFWSSNANQMVSSQQLSGRFIRGVSETTADEGSFSMGGFVVDSLKEKTNKDGQVYRYDLALGQSNYKGDNMSKFVLHVNPSDMDIKMGVEKYQIGQTVEVHGILRFYVNQTTVEQKNEGGFGAPIVRTYVNKQHNFFITSGTAAIVDTAKGMYPSDVIRTLVGAYKARDVELAEKSKSSQPSESSVVEEETKVSSRQTSLI